MKMFTIFSFSIIFESGKKPDDKKKGKSTSKFQQV